MKKYNIKRRMSVFMALVMAVFMAFNVIVCNTCPVNAEEAENETMNQSDMDVEYSKIITSVSLGGEHSAAITDSGALYMWGRNNYGQIGVETSIYKSTPVKIMDNVASVSLGKEHSAAITKSGELYTWGSNYSGKLGDGTYVSTNTPVKIMDNVASVSLGEEHSAAITKSGELYMWGANSNGQVGDGTTTKKITPVKIMDNVASVSLGTWHSAAITDSGELYMWGANTYGQVGDGTTTKKITPVKIMENVASVNLGQFHSAAITKSGELYIWGSNDEGQVGDGTYDYYGTSADKHTPVKIMENVAMVELGYNHSAAITKSGELYIWGSNSFGELGNGTSVVYHTPVKIMDNVASVSLGGNHSAAVTKGGELYIWGNNIYDQLGVEDGTALSRIPIKPVFPPERSDYIKAFVKRLYINVLGRPNPSVAEVSSWATLLADGSQNGATASYGFVFSDEFKSRGLTSGEIVDILYNTFLNREADASGKAVWMAALDSGVDIEYVFQGFVMSTEFAGICDVAGISQGVVSEIPGMAEILNRYRNQNIKLTQFVARCYTKALGRIGDIAGIDSWCMQILTGTWTPRNVAAEGFFHSDEFIAKNTTNAEYVSILYQTFLGRELDAPGYEVWVGLLDRNEWTRDQVLDGFAQSDEFKSILAGFGLE